MSAPDKADKAMLDDVEMPITTNAAWDAVCKLRVGELRWFWCVEDSAALDEPRLVVRRVVSDGSATRWIDTDTHPMRLMDYLGYVGALVAVVELPSQELVDSARSRWAQVQRLRALHGDGGGR